MNFSYVLPLLIFLHKCNAYNKRTIDGCPVYGCNTAGTFSHKTVIPRHNVSVAWTSQNFSEAIPEPLGCIGNSVDLICQFVGTNTSGLASFDIHNGSVRWTDRVLHFPPLPLMNVNGDVIGSDGVHLVKYDVNGQLYHPVIDFMPSFKNIFSMTIMDDDILLIVSREGALLTYETNGVPYSFIWLNDTVEGISGTFHPIAPAVVAVDRAYIFTEFKPGNTAQMKQGTTLHRRVYAVDIPQTMVGKMKIVWYRDVNQDFVLKSPFDRENVEANLEIEKTNSFAKAQLLYSSVNKMLFVSVPETVSSPPFLLALFDRGTTTEAVFQLPVAASGMVMSDVDTADCKTRFSDSAEHTTSSIPLWFYESTDQILFGVSPVNGTIIRRLDLRTILQVTGLVITSNISLTVGDKKEHEFVFAIIVKVESQSTAFKMNYPQNNNVNSTSFVVAIDTGINEDNLLWLIPVPFDAEVKGQIVGVKDDTRINYAGITKTVVVSYAHKDKGFIFGIK